MAKFELSIYGDDEEIIKTHTANIVPWSVFLEAAELEETLKDKSAKDQMKAVGEILKSVFHSLTDEELSRADGNDVMNTFIQIVAGGQKIKGGKAKNA